MSRILLVADKRGWVFERHCREIRARICEHHFDIAYYCDGNVGDLQRHYDLVYLLDAYPFRLPDPSRVIMGVRAEWLYLGHRGGARGFYRERVKRRCAMVHVVNRRQYEALRPVVTDKPLLLVQHGVDHRRFAAVPRRDPRRGEEFVVGSAGREGSRGQKGFDIVAQACAAVGARHVSALHDRAGRQHSPESMPAFYAQLDAYCLMSATEGLNNTLLEAGAMGVPVVSTRAGAAPEIIESGRNGFLVERDADALAAVLRHLRDDPPARSRAGERLRATIEERWTWDARIEDFRAMFERFFGERGNRRRHWFQLRVRERS